VDRRIVGATLGDFEDVEAREVAPTQPNKERQEH
jgi:hypothetical protein